MEPLQGHNPAIPSALAMPRYLPRLPDAEHSRAVQVAEQRRAKIYVGCLGLVYLTLLVSALPKLLRNDVRAILLGLTGMLYLLALVLKSSHTVWLNSRGFIVAGLPILFAVLTFPETAADANSAMHCLLVLILLSGALFLSTSLYVSSVSLSAGITGFLIVRFFGASLAWPHWLELGASLAVSLVLQRTQARFFAHYKEMTLTDEARFAFYSKATDETKKTQNRFERLSNAGREALIFHSDGKITDANSLAAEVLHENREELIGRPIAEVLAPGSQKIINHISDPKNNSLIKVRVVRRDGTVFEAHGFNHQTVFPEGAISVLGLRPIERVPESETGTFLMSASRN